MKTRNLFLTLAVLGAMLPLSAHASVVDDPTPMQQPTPTPTPATGSDEALYVAGNKAMDEHRWADAAAAFDKVAAGKGRRADAALYWKAYNLDKLGRKAESQAACDSLKQQFSSSPWNRECDVLKVTGSVADAREIASQVRDQVRVQVRDDARAKVLMMGPDGAKIYSRGSHEASEDDIKLLALNALLQQEPAKALPLLHDYILSDKPIEQRRQALFILSRSKDPQAQAMLLDVVSNAKDSTLQLEAIQALAIYRPKDAGPTLVKVYQSTSDTKVKRAVLNGLFISRDAARLVELARGEKDLNLKRDIVSQLAIMHDPVATAYMEELLK
jgi:hypothetical protein